MRTLLPFVFAVAACGADDPSSPDAATGDDASGGDAPAVDAPIDATTPTCPTGSAVETLATGGEPRWMAIDDSHVYWVSLPGGSGSDGTIMRVAKTGGTPETLASGETDPVEIAVDGTYVYWARSTGGTIVRVPRGGGTIATVATTPNVRGFAVDTTHAYWTYNNGGIGGVSRQPLAGGNVEPLVTGVLGIGRTPALDATDVYYSALTAVAKVPKVGGTGADVPGTSGGITERIVVDAASIYWVSDSSMGSVHQIPKAGGTKLTLATNEDPQGLAVATHLYWTSEAERIVRAPVAGGTKESVAEMEYNPREIATDDCYVYWIDQASLVGSSFTGKVARRTKH
jgi:hypothetical protein